MVWWWLAMACSEPRALDAALAAHGDAARGNAQYQMTCARCHGQRGGGVGRSPSLARAAAEMPDRDLIATILHGRGGMRPQPIDDQTAADIKAFVRTLAAP
jgi:mono/diheme cytochrome c family protein